MIGPRCIILPIAAAIAIAVPSVAGAAQGQFWGGPVAGGSNNAGMEFLLKKKNHKPHKLVKFNWHNVPVESCFDSFDGKGFNLLVNGKGKFHGSFDVPQSNHKATVHGKFKHHNKKAVGTLELKGSFAGGCANADSGPLPWTAKKGG